ncbi:cupin domain-containing protein [Pseudodesulfovibrio cashew]|uniref:Cupin domain-containing protein n=1 Tax=Pseudodesulfovibrio cashew TaxID=2678688 RepID=A0A6I6JHX0_9BACT|nr:cupin domain-containing protein [Pseudodesulfovibrio cashew]QGY39717.1 cupin domain-containing protein [Pseudodesulfovibrio cashew]
MKELSAEEVIDILGLEPHPEEGGYFRETHRAEELLGGESVPSRYAGDRCHSTAIYYLLTPGTYSHMHLLQSDEIFHFYLGDSCEMLQLHPDGAGEVVRFGTNLPAGERPQVRVPRGSWQGMRLVPGGRFALMGCTVAPGFEYEDYAHGDRSVLLEKYPDFEVLVRELTAG